MLRRTLEARRVHINTVVPLFFGHFAGTGFAQAVQVLGKLVCKAFRDGIIHTIINTIDGLVTRYYLPRGHFWSGHVGLNRARVVFVVVSLGPKHDVLSAHMDAVGGIADALDSDQPSHLVFGR